MIIRSQNADPTASLAGVLGADDHQIGLSLAGRTWYTGGHGGHRVAGPLMSGANLQFGPLENSRNAPLDADPHVRAESEVLGSGWASYPRWRLAAVAPVYGWGVAAALAAAAPFAAVNTLEVHLPNGRVRIGSIDGWGRDHPHHALQFYGHDIRFGIALWACALGLLAAGVLLVLAVRAADAAALRHRAMVAAIAAPSMLVGVVASMALSAQSYVDNISTLSAERGPSLTAGEALYVAGYGEGVWLSLAALAVAVLSSYVFLRRLLLEPVGGRARLDSPVP